MITSRLSLAAFFCNAYILLDVVSVCAFSYWVVLLFTFDSYFYVLDISPRYAIYFVLLRVFLKSSLKISYIIKFIIFFFYGSSYWFIFPISLIALDFTFLGPF